jgi:hypothetical protein
MQVLNVVMFSRWACKEHEELAKSLRMISVGIMGRPGARQSARYLGKDMPKYKPIVMKVHAECTKFLQASTNGCDSSDGKKLQELLVVGFQVLMAPMRGKPYYTLSNVDDTKNSMHAEACFGLIISCSIVSTDVLKFEGGAFKLIIRDQKTSRTMGTYICPVPDLLGKLLRIWMDHLRPVLMKEAGLEHDNVFWNMATKKPFNQQGFSKYTKRSFKNVVNEEVNLQIIRRVFTDGAPLKGHVLIACRFPIFQIT